jgi:phosphatidate cytidylyltransferase
MWVGFLGSFAALMLRYPNREGIAFLGGAIIATVANDVGALFAGRQWGSAPMAADISPNKTWEGALGGTFATFVACAILGWQSAVWDLGSGLALALVVSIVAPLGDLSESMIKRDLGVKDMGSLLPGHGGVLDRFDAILFVLPAVYYLVELLNLAS